MPLGAGAIPVNSKLPSDLLSEPSLFHPETTLIETAGWLFSAVENT